MNPESVCYLARRGIGACEGDCTLILTLSDHRQTAEYDCGDMALRTVYDFHHIERQPKLATPQEGTSPSQIEADIRNEAHLGVLVGEATVADLKHWCNSGRPAICLVTWPGDVESHWVVVAGVRRGEVHLQDPFDGPQTVRVRDFEAMWHGAGRLEVFVNWSIVASA